MDICKDFGGCFCVYTLYTMKALVNVPGLSECTLGDKLREVTSTQVQKSRFVYIYVLW